jgi:ergothioneine biosynthesis protein EgtB
MVLPELKEASASGLTPLLRHYLSVRGASLVLAEPLQAEDCVVQTIPEVSPTKWHLAHVTWFFEKFCLLEHSPGYRLYNEAFHYLFNSYYYSVGQMHARSRRGLLSRPLLGEIVDYRLHVDAAMRDLIDAADDQSEVALKVTLGLHHEQQHQELLLTDIKHVFFSNPLGPAYAESKSSEPQSIAPLKFVERPSGRYSIGANDDTDFHFDNESPAHEVIVGDHALSNRLITNAEFRQFIDDGGYEDSRLWMADGWHRVLCGEIRRPLYWSENLEYEFTLSGWQPLDSASSVCHLSYYEADAFARWAGARLPLESEWELAAKDSTIKGNLLDHGRMHPLPANRNDSEAGGIQQLWGDVWEWTSSPYAAYPKFKPLAGSLGEYNGKFMANQMVVRGGSCVTWASHLRPTYRSFFYPHDRWQFLGIRLAKDR